MIKENPIYNLHTKNKHIIIYEKKNHIIISWNTYQIEAI